jgi:hypothetical protein
VEEPVYLTVLYFLARSFGLEGAAMAWVLRMSVNCIVLHAMTWRLLTGARKAIKKDALMAAICVAVIAVAGMLFNASAASRSVYLVFSLTGALLTMWFCLISRDERTEMVAVLSLS